MAAAVCAACLLLAGCGGRGPGPAEYPTAGPDTPGQLSSGQAEAADPGQRLSPKAGPADSDSAGQAGEDGRRLKVAATLFPYYDFTRQIAGDLVDLELVIPAGMDSHSFEPTPAHMRTIQEADVLICNGGSMEQWVSQVLDAIDTSSMTVVTMMDYVDAVEEEIVEGMEDEEHGHEAEYDEHIWTSPVNAMAITKVIAEALAEADPAHEAEYMAGQEAYLKELQQVHEDFLQVTAQRKRDMIVVADKFPFRYLTEEYGLTYRAAFSGCSTDTEPSARTIAYLIEQVKQRQIPAVYYLELSSPRVAEIICEETEAEPLLLHSCHNVTRAQLDGGVTYVELMKGNVENLRKGLVE